MDIYSHKQHLDQEYINLSRNDLLWLLALKDSARSTIQYSNMSSSMKIEFLQPERRNPDRERRSKLIDPRSDLYTYLEEVRNELIKRYSVKVAPKRMDFHIEILDTDEVDDKELFLERVAELEGSIVDDNFGALKNAWVLHTPPVSRYGSTHITIAYFPAGIPEDLATFNKSRSKMPEARVSNFIII